MSSNQSCRLVRFDGTYTVKPDQQRVQQDMICCACRARHVVHYSSRRRRLAGCRKMEVSRPQRPQQVPQLPPGEWPQPLDRLE